MCEREGEEREKCIIFCHHLSEGARERKREKERKRECVCDSANATINSCITSVVHLKRGDMMAKVTAKMEMATETVQT